MGFAKAVGGAGACGVKGGGAQLLGTFAPTPITLLGGLSTVCVTATLCLPRDITQLEFAKSGI